MVIESKAPTRIDLAGGTLDIWPLYLFLKHPFTVNLGINLFAEAMLEEAPARSASAGEVLLRSDDQGVELRLPWNALDSLTPPPALELHFKLLRYFKNIKQEYGSVDTSSSLVLKTRALSPAGAGLGGSSALCVAIIGVLSKWAHGHKEIDREHLIEIAKDIETTVIQVPAGLQDYYAAMFGGLQTLRWQAASSEHYWLPTDIALELEKRILLFYTGQSRNSGINNWEMFKNFIDKKPGIFQKFENIGRAANELEQALLGKKWDAVGTAISEEWQIRSTLADGISTAQMDQAYALAKKLGATGFKVCGAGGGGCFFIYLPTDDYELKERVRTQVCELGIQALMFSATMSGLEVRVKS